MLNRTVCAVLGVAMTVSVAVWGGERPQQTLFTSGEGAAEYRIPSMITTKDGTVIALCDARVDRSGDVPNNIDQVLRRSRDGGATWGDLITAVDLPGTHGAADPSLVQDRDTGRIFLYYGYCPGRNDTPQGANRDRRHLVLHYTYSDDDGLTWSLPTHVDTMLRKDNWHSMWPGPGRGLQTREGHLLVPCTVYLSPEEGMGSYVAISEDHGETWRMSATGVPGINEPTIVELDDGRWMLNCRNQTGTRALTYSADGGQSWSAPVFHETLIEPGCQGSMILCPRDAGATGASVLLFSNPASRKGRWNMTVRASIDDGKTWPFARTIHAEGAAYSCLTILPDGQVGLLYEHPYSSIQFTQFSLEWLLQGTVP